MTIMNSVLRRRDAEALSLRQENDRLRAVIRLYLTTYADTNLHPRPLEEARVIMAAREALDPPR